VQTADMVYNPNAGRFPSGILAERAAEVLRAHGWKIRLFKTRNAEHITQLARQAALDGKEALFVVGGDGTINLAVRGLKGSSTALGVLPGGTANVLAQELGLPGLSWTRWMALEESAKRLAEAEVKEVDIGECAGIPFLMWAGVGLDAFAIHHIEPRPRGEKLFANVAYAASTAYHASLWHGLNLRVAADRVHFSGHYLLALVSNIHLYAGGLAQVSPHARLDDGMMDLWLFEGDTLGDTIEMAWDLYAGRHVDSEKVRYFPFKQLVFESDSTLYVQVDAEPLPCSGYSVKINVVPHGIRLLVPKKTPRELFNHKDALIKY
jgi:diacylglycerol kinase (ATP)